MINKSDSHCAVVRFCYHSYDYRLNWTPLSPITITSRHVFGTRVHEGLLKHIARLLMCHYHHSLSIHATIMVSKNCSITGEHVGIISARWNFFLLWNFDKQNEMQLLAKFKQILYMGFRASLNFRKFKVALIPRYRIALNVSLNLSIYCSLGMY